ncbi:heavy metal-associated isoprenylated plant protein 43-like isoform X2 [Gastrolobium bilobum]|uniref:heavy metal-associated isoprenylated plant protein 43-like isoform X2 n=1 Tax=Gastrolobium bilobum TaxID=150636 RepID=UPI002AAF5CFA|nr:heavy metal-associated isoprenylated plant protein 43-like isoform X2 [Gastrolobium bilobum]
MKKIVIRLELKCDKCRRKALKIAADTQGVSSVAVEGDQLTVTGDMDVVCLSRKLVKNFRCVNVVRVEEMKKKVENPPPPPPPKKPCYCPPPPPPCVPYPSSCVVYDPYGPYPNICSIM